MLRIKVNQNINLLLKKHENSGLKRLLFNIQMICQECRKCNNLIVFGDMIADMKSNKKIYQIVTKYIYRRKKTKNFFCFHYGILLLSNKRC